MKRGEYLYRAYIPPEKFVEAIKFLNEKFGTKGKVERDIIVYFSHPEKWRLKLNLEKRTLEASRVKLEKDKVYITGRETRKMLEEVLKNKLLYDSYVYVAKRIKDTSKELPELGFEAVKEVMKDHVELELLRVSKKYRERKGVKARISLGVLELGNRLYLLPVVEFWSRDPEKVKEYGREMEKEVYRGYRFGRYHGLAYLVEKWGLEGIEKKPDRNGYVSSKELAFSGVIEGYAGKMGEFTTLLYSSIIREKEQGYSNPKFRMKKLLSWRYIKAAAKGALKLAKLL